MAVVAAALAGASPVAATPAYATVGSCTIQALSDSSSRAKCDGTPPSAYRAFIVCMGGTTRYGGWFFAGSGSWSYATCPVNQFWIDFGVQINP